MVKKVIATNIDILGKPKWVMVELLCVDFNERNIYTFKKIEVQL